MSYQPWVGTLDDGTEILVTIQQVAAYGPDDIASVEVAFRTPQYRTWGPPVECRRAP